MFSVISVFTEKSLWLRFFFSLNVGWVGSLKASLEAFRKNVRLVETVVLRLQVSPPSGLEGQPPLRTNATLTRTTSSAASVRSSSVKLKKNQSVGCEQKVAVLVVK